MLDVKINIGGWSNISLENWLNLGVSEKENAGGLLVCKLPLAPASGSKWKTYIILKTLLAFQIMKEILVGDG